MQAGNIVLKLMPGSGCARHSEGSFLGLGQGKLLFVWSRFTGGVSDHAAAELAALVSQDKGRRWPARQRLLVQRGPGESNVMSPSLLRLPDGRILLEYLVKRGLDDCRPFVRWSSDQGATWTAARPCLATRSYHVVNNDRLCLLADGRILMPMARHRTLPGPQHGTLALDMHATVVFLESADGGATWSEGATFAVSSLASGLQEPGIVETAPGQLLAWARTDGGWQYWWRSEDGGRHWTTPEPSPFASPCSPMSIFRLADDSLLAVWNDSSGRFPVAAAKESWGRTPLVLARSRDQGRTWQDQVAIESAPDRGFCYVALHQVNDRDLLLAYCAGGGRRGCVLDTLIIRRIFL